MYFTVHYTPSPQYPLEETACAKAYLEVMHDENFDANWIDIAAGARAYLAWPAQIKHPPAVLLYIEAFGVNRHMQEVAQWFAGKGYAAILPDIYHGATFGYDDMDAALDAVRTLDGVEVMRESQLALKARGESSVQ